MSLFNVFLGYEKEDGKWYGDMVIFSKELIPSYFQELLKNKCDVEKAITSIKKSLAIPVEADIKCLNDGNFELIGAYLIYDKNINGLALYHNNYVHGDIINGNTQIFRPCFYITIDVIESEAETLFKDTEFMEEVNNMFANFNEECIKTEIGNVELEIKDINDSGINHFNISVDTSLDKETLEDYLNEMLESFKTIGINIDFEIKDNN